jgi:acetyl esterase/lipase
MTDETPEDDGAARFGELLAMLSGVPSEGGEPAPVREYPELAEVQVTDVVIDGPHGAVLGRSYRGPAEADIGLVWVHGGAFVAGDLDMPESHWVALELAMRGIRVLALDYQKALNGVHHPVLSDEVLAGWLAAATADLLDVPVERLHLGGASAGANLAAGVALRLRSRSEPSPASIVLAYPALHPFLPAANAAAAAAADTLADEQRFTPGFFHAVNVNYVGDVAGLGDTIAFPSNSAPEGLPPTFILNAEADDLRASGEAFAAQLAEADVPVLLEFEPGTAHGYLNEPELPAAVRSIDRIVRWLGAGT